MESANLSDGRGFIVEFELVEASSFPEEVGSLIVLANSAGDVAGGHEGGEGIKAWNA